MAEQLMQALMSSAEARHHYELLKPAPAPEASQVDQQLLERGIARIAMSLNEGDFQRLTTGFEASIATCPDLLADSYHIVDERLGNSAGYVRKERKINAAGRQIEDPKSLIHFTESAHDRWNVQYKTAPKVLREFLADGREVQNELLNIAKRQLLGLETTHPNLSRLYFPADGTGSLSFLRILSYDSYDVSSSYAAVAKPHFDIGGVTIQAYADAAGFWGAKDGPHDERVHYDTEPNSAFCFLGMEHAKIYGDDSPLKPLWHGVDRIIPKGVAHVPTRHAVILFVDAPRVDHAITAHDTLPDIHKSVRTVASS